MARRPVIEVSCDRCGKVETQPVDPKADGIHENELVVCFQGQEITYSDLCLRCRSAVENYFKSMTKQPEEEESEEPAPPKKGFLGMGAKAS